MCSVGGDIVCWTRGRATWPSPDSTFEELEGEEKGSTQTLGSGSSASETSKVSYQPSLLPFKEMLKRGYPVLFEDSMRALGLPRGRGSKESACNAGAAGDTGSTSGLGRSPGKGNGNSLQYSCLEKSTDRGDWWVTVRGVAKSQI